MEKHVYLVRHGQSDTNARQVYYSGRDAKLTELGKDQARKVAERVSRLRVEALITSPFPRTKDTAAIIAGETGLTAEENELFGEWVEPSHLEGLHKEHASVLETKRKILEEAVEDHYFRLGDEETFAELLARAQACLEALESHKAERICVVTHGGFLRVLIGLVLFRNDFGKRHFADLMRNFTTSNTGITYIRYLPPRGWHVVSLNDQAHLG